MEPIEVTARFDLQGQITPLRFTWKGRSYLVESTGRCWSAPDGRHMLVMASSGQPFEILFTPGESRWYLEQAGPIRTAA